MIIQKIRFGDVVDCFRYFYSLSTGSICWWESRNKNCFGLIYVHVIRYLFFYLTLVT